MKTTFRMFSRSQHMISNFRFEIDELNNATVRCYLFNPMTFNWVLPAPFFYCGGSYIVKLRRVAASEGAQVWRIYHLDQDMMYNTVGITIVALLLAITFGVLLLMCIR